MSTWKKAFALTMLTAIPMVGYAKCHPKPGTTAPTGGETWSGAASGSWNNAANWSPNTVPGSVFTNKDKATFGSTVGTSSTISLDNPPIKPGLSSLTFNNPDIPYTIIGTPTEIIYFNGPSTSLTVISGDHTILAPIAVNFTNLTVTITNATDTLTFTNNLFEGAPFPSNITLNGQGTFLNNFAFQTINGDYTVSGGTLINFNANPAPALGFIGARISSNNFTAGPGTTVTNQNTGPATNGGRGVFLRANNDLTINGAFVQNLNSGTVDSVSQGSVFQANGTLLLAAGTLNNINTGTVAPGGVGAKILTGVPMLITGGLLYNNDNVWAPRLTITAPGTLAGTGFYKDQFGTQTIQVINGGTVIVGGSAPGVGSGTMTIEGTYLQQPTGTLLTNIGINPSLLDVIGPLGTAQLAGALQVSVVPGSALKTNRFVLVNAQNGITGTFASARVLNTRNFRSQVTYTPTQAILNLFPVIGPTYPQLRRVPRILYRNNLNKKLLIHYRQLDMQRRMAYRDHHPEKPSTPPTAGKMSKKVPYTRTFASSAGLMPFQVASGFSAERADRTDFYNELLKPGQTHLLAQGQEIEQKQQQLKRGLMPPPPPPPPPPPQESYPSHAYFGPTGGFGDSGGDFFWTWGATTGYDYTFSQVGLGINSSYTYSGSPGSDVDEADLSIYATYVPQNVSELSVNATVGGAFDWYFFDSSIGLGDIIPKATTTGPQFNTNVGLTYTLDQGLISAFPENLQISGSVSLAYNRSYVKKYSQHSAGPYDMKIFGVGSKSLATSLELDVYYGWEWDNIGVEPTFSFSWDRDHFASKSSMTSVPIHPASSPATTFSPAPPANTYSAGVDFMVTLFKRYGIEVEYSYGWDDDDQSHSFTLNGNFYF